MSSTEESQALCSTSQNAEKNDSKLTRMERFQRLAKLKEDGKRANHQEVVQEYKRANLPKNWEKKQEWLKRRLEDKEYETYRVKKEKNTDPDTGFSDYESATARKYRRLVKNITPDLDAYEETKEKVGEEVFYASKDTIIQGAFKDSKAGIDNMVQDLNKQIEKRSKFKRRRRFDDDADIDYINDKNMKFNKKLERFYGQYTTEIKQNLERGTAI